MTECKRCGGTPSAACDHGPCQSSDWGGEVKATAVVGGFFRKKQVVVSATQYTATLP